MADNPDITWAISEFQALASSYSLARSYYEGDHPLSFASEKFRTAFGQMFKAFADNLCPCVVETVRDRLKLDGFMLPDATAKATADEIWRRNRLKVRVNQTHLDALIEGDAYAIIWPDKDGEPVFYPNRGSALRILYDDEQPGLIVRAAKVWPANDGRYRLNLYYPDRIEKYVTREKVQGGMPDRASAFMHFDVQGEPWPLPNDYGKVPVFHFGNRAPLGALGKSELSETIPLQNGLNKSVADMLVSSEFYGVPQRWAIGLEEDLTPAQAKKKYPLLAGGVWGTTNKETKFGEFAASDITKFITVAESFRKEIARVSRTPLHYFGMEGRLPSGEALKTAEAPLIAKIDDRQESWGAVWSDAMRFALQIKGAGDFEPEPSWIDTTPRNEADIINQTATKVDKLGVSIEQGQRELRYSEEQIQKMKIERAKDPMVPGVGVVPGGEMQGSSTGGAVN
jgi:SPP1 Gp6-like portal protein